EPERAERIGAISSRYMGSVLKGLLKEHGAELDGAVADAVHGALKGALREDNQREMARVVGSIAEASVKPIAESLTHKGLGDSDVSAAIAKAVTEQSGPALEGVLKNNLAPSMAEAVESEPVRRAMGVAARDLGRHLVLGVNDGITEIRADKKMPEKSSLMD